MSPYRLNERAMNAHDRLLARADELRVAQHLIAGASVIDLGISVAGGLQAGLALAEICLSDLASVRLAPSVGDHSGPISVMVHTDHPVAACLASQYAGWRLSEGKFFAMGSGPMRALAGKEPVFAKLGLKEDANCAVGVLETRRLPPEEIVTRLSKELGVPTERLALLVAPTASQAGGLQVVARSVETALHKLLELEFDVSRVVSAFGAAPLPPVAANDMAAIGRTNDAILYGAEVTLWVKGDDASIERIGPSTPSSASADHGQPFSEIFARYQGDFYKIDPLLFSPAVITFSNLETGKSFRFGRLEPELVARSFES